MFIFFLQVTWLEEAVIPRGRGGKDSCDLETELGITAVSLTSPDMDWVAQNNKNVTNSSSETKFISRLYLNHASVNSGDNLIV